MPVGGSCYIAFAGVDGAGKTTQAKLLSEALRRDGLAATFVPNASMFPVRTMLDGVARKHGASDYVALLGADTARLIAAVLKWQSLDALRAELDQPGAVVVTDRGVACQYAVVRVFNGTNEALLRDIFADAPSPDVTVFVDVPGETARDRLLERGEVSHSPRELDELADAYRSLPEFANFACVDGRGSVAQTHAAVLEVVRPVLERAVSGASRASS